MTQWRSSKLKKLVRVIASLKSEKDLEDFLRDLCTLEELEEFGNRFEAVGMLVAGLSYREIAKETGLSTTTVTRIAHWLHHGEGGYAKALKKLSTRRA